ncbi:MAG: hypothetical protein R2730_07655 [Chitinophagales bacterium]
MNKKPHKSDSKKRLEIEAKIISFLEKEFGQNEGFNGNMEIKGIKFQIDFFNKKQTKFFEIYSGINEIKAGQKRKIAADILKLIYIEKLLEREIDKYLVLIDESIKCKLINGKSWLSKLIETYKIEVKVVDVGNNLMADVLKDKKRQYR